MSSLEHNQGFVLNARLIVQADITMVFVLLPPHARCDLLILLEVVVIRFQVSRSAIPS